MCVAEASLMAVKSKVGSPEVYLGMVLSLSLVLNKAESLFILCV